MAVDPCGRGRYTPAVNEPPLPEAPPRRPALPSGRFLPRWSRVRTARVLSPRDWMRQFVFWTGAILVALTAILFANLADRAVSLFLRVTAYQPLLAFVICPAGLAISVLLTQRVFPGAQGSGIPQVIATLHMADRRLVDQVLSLRIAFGKILLTLLGLACGASIGREGPTVQIGATLLNTFGRYMRLPRGGMERGLVLAGGAAGIAAAFNTPLAGVVFAIEELSHSFESRTSGIVLSAVIIAGIVTIAVAGNYTYFGTNSAQLAIGAGWLAVLVCGVCGGVAGGLFSTLLLRAAAGLPRGAGRWVMRHPVGFAALCGLCIAILGTLSGGATYGTGYIQARAIVTGQSHLPVYFFVLKFLASVVSYVSGIPGGIFAPALAVGAGLGQALSHLLPAAPAGAVVLLAMVGYFAGVVQAPITAIVIVMEMTNNQSMIVPVMATAMVAFGASRLVCPHPIYSALADRFLRAQEIAARANAVQLAGAKPNALSNRAE